MYPYDQQKNPPAPMVQIKVLPRAGVQVNPVTILALADTGADHTCLPANIFFMLNLLPNNTVKVQGATGSGQVNLYSADIEFHNQVFPSCTVAELPSGVPALLGRDIMNAFRLEFNGPSNYLAVL